MNASKLPAIAYRDLLGLDRAPRDFYQLLGLPSREADPQRIEAALRRAAQRLKARKADTTGDVWRALAAQLEAANQTLLEPDRKLDYDQRLERRASEQDSASPAHHTVDPMAPVPVAPSAAPTSIGPKSVDVNAVGITVTPSPGRTARRRTKSTPPEVAARRALLTAFGAFVALILCFLCVLQFWILPNRSQRQRISANVPQSSSDLPLPTSTVTAEPTSQGTAAEAASIRPEPRRRSTGANDELNKPPTQEQTSVTTPLDAQQRKQLHEWIMSTQRALRERRLSDAAASARQAVTLAADTEYEARLSRLDRWADYVHQFWQAYESGLIDLAGTDLIVAGQRVHIVDITEEAIIVKSLGEIQRFDKHDPPPRYALAIADRWFDQAAESTPVFRAAYLLSTEAPDRNEIRSLWQRAADQGAALGDLPRILDDTYDDLLP